MQRLDVRLSPQGRRDLEGQLEALEAERRATAEWIGDARGGGADPTENLDLRDAMERLTLVEGRIAQVKATLGAAEPLEFGPDPQGAARLGATVRLRLADGEEATYQLVSPAEAAPRRGRLSVESPIGRALIGHRPGERVLAETPAGQEPLELLAVA